jgi:hypothetical protein
MPKSKFEKKKKVYATNKAEEQKLPLPECGDVTCLL